MGRKPDRHASSRALPTGLPSRELHDCAVIRQPLPCAKACPGSALLLGSILEGADRVGVFVYLHVSRPVQFRHFIPEHFM